MKQLLDWLQEQRRLANKFRKFYKDSIHLKSYWEGKQTQIEETIEKIEEMEQHETNF